MTSLLQLNAPVTHVWRRPLKDSTASNREEHLNPQCGFVKQWEWVIVGTNTKICLLIRQCVCGIRPDKTHLLQKKSLTSSEFGDGVELHLYTRDNRQNCDYIVTRKQRGNFICYEHVKSCFF
ncbi:hypothetical protein ACJMK2_017428 [Sinanodonta woodiana]|uniref:Uncharacterized protein n=1 Tax=Sinanodonta woodiana TaxID=1069815 RepID=A0ABD3UE55_SINWO